MGIRGEDHGQSMGIHGSKGGQCGLGVIMGSHSSEEAEKTEDDEGIRKTETKRPELRVENERESEKNTLHPHM